MPIVKCELQCNIDTLATLLNIIVDPHPQSISCLRQHSLSSGGSGLWLILTRDTVLASKGHMIAIIQKVSGVGERDRDGDQLRFNGGDKIATVSNKPQQDDMIFENLGNEFVDMPMVHRSSYWAKSYTHFLYCFFLSSLWASLYSHHHC